MARLFFDTNVLLDYALGREPGCSAFVEIVELAEKDKHTLCTASTSIKDCFYVISSSLKAANKSADGVLLESVAQAASKIAWAQIENIMRIVQVVSVGHQECMNARSYRSLHNDFEDNLVLAAARTAKADYLVTSDEKLIQHAPLACLSPRDLLALIRPEQF